MPRNRSKYLLPCALGEHALPGGHGEEVWEHAAGELLTWGIKTRSGFEVPSRTPVATGRKLEITARLCGVRVVEPVEVISVVREPNRVGFAYRTLPGHPGSASPTGPCRAIP